MKHKFEIDVMQCHIDQGKKDDCSKCPIALALKELGFVGLKVDIDDLYKTVNQYIRISIKIPFRATNFIDTFDHGFLVKPFKFTIAVDDHDLKYIT